MKNRMSLPGQALVRAAALLPLLLAAVMFSACSKTTAEPAAKAVVETNSDPDVFTLQNAGQFPLAKVEVRKVSDEIHLNGVIAPDVNRSVPVVSLGGGRVVEIKAKLGDSVRKGQTLLLIDSPDVSQAFSDYQKFKADEQLAAKQLARAQLLYDKGAIAQAELELAQDADAKAKVDAQTAAQRVKVLGGNLNNPSPLLPMPASRAPPNSSPTTPAWTTPCASAKAVRGFRCRPSAPPANPAIVSRCWPASASTISLWKSRSGTARRKGGGAQVGL